MSPALPVILRGGNTLRDPRRLPGMAAWFDGMDPSTLAIDGSNRTSLVSDKSGNSGENGLVLNGAAGNAASTPDAAPLDVTGDLDIDTDMAADSWVPASEQAPVSKGEGDGTQSYVLRIETTGALRLFWWDSGGTLLNKTSTASTGFSAFARRFIRCTLDLDNGASGHDVKFFTSSDGITWTQLGSTVTTAGTTSIRAGTSSLQIGRNGTAVVNGIIYRARIYNGMRENGGTLVFDANFAAQSKLATSFTESSANAATVTINTSGATGARISGARDLYQGTVGSQPAYSLANRTLTFDGADDFLKTAAFTLNQPTTVYFVGSAITWQIGDTLFDGNTNLSGAVVQDPASPQITAFAGTNIGFSPDFVVGTRALITVVFKGASTSSFGVNNLAPVVGSSGANNMGGFTLGVRGGGSSGPSNITVNEIAIYNTAHTAAQQAQFWQYARRKWGIAG